MATTTDDKNEEPETAWALAKEEILGDVTLSDSERTLLKTCTINDVINEIRTVDHDHAAQSKSRKVMAYLQPVLDGLERYGKAMDVLSQTDPQGILAFTWGSIRLLIAVAKGFTKYFDQLVEFLGDVARPMARLEAYGILIPKSERLQITLRHVFIDFLQFMMETRRMFIDKTNQKHSLFERFEKPGMAIFRKNIWKDFGDKVTKQIKHINSLFDDAEREAKLAVDQTTVEGQARQENKADNAYIKADGAYTRQDVAAKNIIAIQTRQIDNARAESHLSHVERDRQEKERQAQDQERQLAAERAELVRQESSKQEAEREAARIAREKADADRERQAKQHEEDAKAKDAALLKEVVEWLNPVDAIEDFRQIREQRMQGTCEWILQNPTLKKWFDAPVGTENGHRLWIHAFAGTGKTFLCTRIVEYLQEQSKSVAIFYCDTKDDKKRKVENVLRSWAWQLLLNSPGKLRNVADLYRSGKQSNATLFADAVKTFLKDGSERFLVLDALDECEMPVRIEISKILSEFKTAKILVTSRNEPDIKRAMAKAGSEVSTIKIEPTDNALDIKHYLDVTVEEMDNDDKELDSRITEELFDASNGMFLYARLMIDELSQLPTPEDIEEALDKLPADLNTIYGRILSRIEEFPIEANKKNARLLLKWICAAVEPLTLEQIRDITAYNLDSDEDQLNPKKKLRSPEKFIEMCCGPLVEIGTYDHKIRISHASVKDYLLDRGRTGEASYFVDIDEAHSVLARSCLAHLSYTNIDVVDVGSDHDSAMEKLDKHIKSLPMLYYTTLHWWRHTLYCASPMDSHIQRAFRKFATNNRHGVKWLQALHILRGDHGTLWHPGRNNYVSLLSRLMQINRLWKDVCDDRTWLDELDDKAKFMRFYTFLTSYSNDYYPAISIGALFNLPDFVEAELARGIHVDQTNWLGESPIMLAARGNSVATTAVLIKQGANVNHIGDQTECALHRAISWNGLTVDESWSVREIRYDTVPLLLEAGADVHHRNFAGDTLTHYVLGADWELPVTVEVLQWILDAGGREDLAVRNNAGRTPLSIAAWVGLKGCVQLLLDAGADPNDWADPNDKFRIGPIFDASKKDDITIGLALIDAGARVNAAEGEHHRTPLMEAVIRGSLLVEALLKAGAEPNVADKDGLYPIHFAAIENTYKSIPILLEHGADVNIKDRNGKTALDLAIEHDQAEAQRVLIRSGGIKAVVDAPQASTATLVYPQTESDTLHTYFLLKKATRGQLHRNRMVGILQAAEYWIRSTVDREDYAIITQDDEDEHQGFLPYIISQPISGAELYPVQKIIITTNSHDQGYSSYPQHRKSYNLSWTGFRLRVRRTPSSSDDWRKYLENQGKGEEDIRKILAREEYDVQANRHGYLEPKRHINTWARHDNHDELVKSLRKGDVLEIVPWALYPGWQCHVLSVKLEIFTAYLALP